MSDELEKALGPKAKANGPAKSLWVGFSIGFTVNGEDLPVAKAAFAKAGITDIADYVRGLILGNGTQFTGAYVREKVITDLKVRLAPPEAEAKVKAESKGK